MADVTIERNAELTKEVALLKSRNKTLGNIVNVDKDILIKSKEQATAMGELGDNVKSIGNNLLSGAENMTTSIFGGALGGVLNSLTIGMVKRRNENAKIEKDKAKEVAKASAEEKAQRQQLLDSSVDILRDTKKYKNHSREQVEAIVRASELEKEIEETKKAEKEEKKRLLDFTKKATTRIKKLEKDGGIVVQESPEDKKSTKALSIAEQQLKFQQVIASGTATKEEKEEARRLAEKGGESVKVKLEGAEDKSGFSLMDIFTKGGRTKLLGSLATGLTGLASFAFGPEGGLMAGMKGMKFGKLAGFAALTTSVVMMASDVLQGLANHEKWGVSSSEAAIGAALGGVGKGISGAAYGATKFGTAGFTAGLAFGPVGAIIGGTIGAIMGAIMGYFGGEAIAKLIKKAKVKLGLDTFTDEEIEQNLEQEKKDLDNKIKKAEQNPVLQPFLEELRMKRAGLEGESENRKNEAAKTRRTNTAILAEKEKGSIGGGFYGAKFLFDAFPSMRGILDPELAKEVYGEGGNLARGGFIVNQPSYLPGSGVVVGEHGTYSGRGLAYGGIADGGPEAVIPLSSPRAGAFIDPMARSVSGVVMNQLAMARLGGGAGGGSPTVVTGNDMSSNQVNNSTTVVNNPSPIGQMLPDEGRDFVSKVA